MCFILEYVKSFQNEINETFHATHLLKRFISRNYCVIKPKGLTKFACMRLWAFSRVIIYKLNIRDCC